MSWTVKILIISDVERRELWEGWDQRSAEKFSDISLVLSAGDLDPRYLEFIVTMLNVPLLYVRGNHDDMYHERPPEGCICIEDTVTEIRLAGDPGAADARVLRIAGLGGSLRYSDGRNMYTEKQMAGRVRRLTRKIRWDALRKGRRPGPDIDILLTHAPCRGYGDLDDMPHRGFACFNELLENISAGIHCYGHVHMEYGRIERETMHPTGTRLINCSGGYILER